MISLILASLLALSFLLFQSQPFVFYLSYHPQSLGIPSFIQCAHTFKDFSLTLFLFIGFFSLGQFLTNRFQKENWIISILVGEAVLALTLFIAGILNFFKPFFLYFLFFLVLAGVYRERSLFLKFFTRLKKLQETSWNWILALTWTGIMISLLRILVATGAPPTDWDSLSYHLALPKIYLEAQKIVPIRWAINANYPLNTEMIYLLGMFLECDRIPHWINFFHGLLVLLLLYQLSREYLGLNRNWSLFSLLLLSAQPLFHRVSGNGSTDLAVAASFLGAILTALNGSYFLSGCLAGISMSVKMTGIWMAFALFLTMLVTKTKARFLFHFALGALIFGFPWYLKNWITLGNPFWPYLGEWFHANARDLDSWHRIQSSVTEGIEKNIWNYLTLPYHGVVHSYRFLYQCHYLLVPFFILGMAKLLKKIPFNALEKMFLYTLFFTFTLWFWTYQNWRYLLPVLGLIVLLMAQWTQDLWKENNLYKAVSYISLFSLIPLCFLSINNELFVFLSLKPESSRISAKDKYLQQTLGPAYAVTQVTNEILPSSSKILLYKEVRGYYLNREYAWGDPLNPGVFSYREMRNSLELYSKIKGLGFTHILYNPTIGEYRGDRAYYEKSDQLMRELLQTKTRLLYGKDGVGLFELI